MQKIFQRRCKGLGTFLANKKLEKVLLEKNVFILKNSSSTQFSL